MKKLFFTLFLSFLCALALLSVSPYGLRAAPISGSFLTEVVFYPQHGVSREGQDPISKVDLVNVKFEADLVLTFSLSGIEVTSTTAFTFRGVEFQSFVLHFTLGALTLRNTTIFAPTFFEFEELRDQFGRLRWCLLRPSIPMNREPCDTPDFVSLPFGGGLYAHILDPDFGILPWHRFFGANAIHPVAQNLALARWVESFRVVPPNWMRICRTLPPVLPSIDLGGPLDWRRNITDFSMLLGGLRLGGHLLFAYYGFTVVIRQGICFTIEDYRDSGLMVYLEGQTVSGVLVRGELWLGAKQGLACFGECKPLERFYNAMVTGGGLQNPEEEKLFIKNLVIAGVRHDLLAEF
ncbi:MAG: hypothetical protein NZ610_07650, partial [Candidatus Bipolaricaulota bacterium]|nr:hypothetical protein [Candidatus Bipolaricaulota bacterium]